MVKLLSSAIFRRDEHSLVINDAANSFALRILSAVADFGYAIVEDRGLLPEPPEAFG